MKTQGACRPRHILSVAFPAGGRGYPVLVLAGGMGRAGWGGGGGVPCPVLAGGDGGGDRVGVPCPGPSQGDRAGILCPGWGDRVRQVLDGGRGHTLSWSGYHALVLARGTGQGVPCPGWGGTGWGRDWVGAGGIPCPGPGQGTPSSSPLWTDKVKTLPSLVLRTRAVNVTFYDVHKLFILRSVYLAYFPFWFLRRYFNVTAEIVHIRLWRLNKCVFQIVFPIGFNSNRNIHVT